MEDDIARAVRILRQSRYVVALTGAGISEAIQYRPRSLV